MIRRLFLLVVCAIACCSDDALAILLALSVPQKIRVLAITCSYGNTWLKNVERNVLNTLAIANRTDIPVYSGAEKPLIRDYTATDYFGADGFGNFDFDRTNKTSSNVTIDRSKHAALAMIDLVKQHPGEVSIVTMGPTTNVALAVSLDPSFARNVRRIHAMGSKPYKPNETEFNFGLDPESNAVLLGSQTQLTKMITTGHIAADNKIDKNWRIGVLGKIGNERIDFLNNAESLVLERLNEWQAADSMTLATIIWPELITESVEARMAADTCHRNNPGAVTLQQPDAGEYNVRIVKAFDVEAFKRKLLENLA